MHPIEAALKRDLVTLNHLPSKRWLVWEEGYWVVYSRWPDGDASIVIITGSIDRAVRALVGWEGEVE